MATSKRERQRQRSAAARQRQQSADTVARTKRVGLRLVLVALVIVGIVAGLWFGLRGDSGDDSDDVATSEETDTPETERAVDGPPDPPEPGGTLTGPTPCAADLNLRTTSFEQPPPADCTDPMQDYQAVIATTEGDIEVTLDPQGAPNAVNAFVVLARHGYYDGSAIFYTDLEGGEIRGGAPHTNSTADPGPGFVTPADEGPFEYSSGQLIWDPQTAQFRLTVNDAAEDLAFDPPLPVIGELDLASLTVVSGISSLHTDNPDTAIGGWPSRHVIVESVTVQTDQTDDPDPQEEAVEPDNCPEADGTSPQIRTFDGPQPMCIDPDKQYTAVFDTSAGEIRVALDVQNTPVTANNFVVLSRYHYYDDTTLFRTDPSIGIIQGGAAHTNAAADPGPGYTIPDEGGGYRYEPGQLVMARTSAPNSAGAQFFFTVTADAALLNNQGTYVVFGRLENPESREVTEQILASHVPGGNLGGAPDPQVVVSSVTIIESE